MNSIVSIECKSAKEIPSVIDKIKGIKHRLTGMNVLVEDSFIIAIILKALPPDMQGFKSNWDFLDVESQTLDRFILKLREKSEKVFSESSNGTAMVTVQDRFKKEGNRRIRPRRNQSAITAGSSHMHQPNQRFGNIQQPQQRFANARQTHQKFGNVQQPYSKQNHQQHVNQRIQSSYAQKNPTPGPSGLQRVNQAPIRDVLYVPATTLSMLLL